MTLRKLRGAHASFFAGERHYLLQHLPTAARKRAERPVLLGRAHAVASHALCRGRIQTILAK